MFGVVNPIILSPERKGAERDYSTVVDSRVRGFVLEIMNRSPGGLLPTAMAPQMLIQFERGRKRKKVKLKKGPLLRKEPIGIHGVGSSWINALMQLILYVPGYVDFFHFLPKSFDVFQDFIDQYGIDLQEGRVVSLADSRELLQFVTEKLGVSLEEVFVFLNRILQTKWDVCRYFEEGVKRGVRDFFVLGQCLRRQFFSEGLIYDLDAFIEFRPDGNVSGHYFAYVKVEGVWFQCDDERIVRMKSNCLMLALQRSVLLHYKRLFMK
jgi:hypothetical protein